MNLISEEKNSDGCSFPSKLSVSLVVNWPVPCIFISVSNFQGSHYSEYLAKLFREMHKGKLWTWIKLILKIFYGKDGKVLRYPYVYIKYGTYYTPC